MERVQVAVCALDPITRAGLVDCLGKSGLAVVADQDDARVEVVTAAFGRWSPEAVGALRSVAERYGKPVVLIVSDICEAELLTAVECRVVTILPRTAATGRRLAEAVRTAAAGGASFPPNLLGHLVAHVQRLHREVLRPTGLSAASLSAREIDVLRLMADGLDTDQIARNLRYSERTVKNIIYATTKRLCLRNRTHLVAYAMRAGVI